MCFNSCFPAQGAAAQAIFFKSQVPTLIPPPICARHQNRWKDFRFSDTSSKLIVAFLRQSQASSQPLTPILVHETKCLPAPPLQGELYCRLNWLCTILLIKIAIMHSGFRVFVNNLAQ